MPDDLSPQFAAARPFFEAFDWTVETSEDLEADDLLGSYLLDAREELLAFKDIATLRDAGVDPPPDRETDWAGAATAAREHGMNRLAERLEAAAAA